jgi:hypothetical protein
MYLGGAIIMKTGKDYEENSKPFYYYLFFVNQRMI